MNYNGKIALKAINDQYLSAIGGGGQAIVPNQSKIDTWETFQLYDWGNGYVALQTMNKQYVSAEVTTIMVQQSGQFGQPSNPFIPNLLVPKQVSGNVVANRNTVNTWETFKLIDRGNGKVAFQTSTGQYLCAEGGGGKPLVANRDTIGDWETFTVVDMVSGVNVYSDANYSGKAQQLIEGNYDVNALLVGNDQISSLRVPKGMKVTLYEHGGFSGRSKVFTADTSYVGDDFNDITSSLKVESLSVAPVIQPQQIAAIREQGTKLAEGRKPLSEGYKTYAPDNITPKPIAELVKSDELFQYQLSKRLSVQNNTLTLSKDLLQQFGEVGEIVSAVLNIYVSIQNPTIKYVKITPGKVGVAGVPFSDDITTDQTPATVQSTALQLSGDMVLLSSVKVRLQYAEFGQLKLKPYGVFKFILADEFGLGSLFKGVPVLEGINISEPTLIISSTPYLYDPSLGYGISMGFNFFGKFQIGSSKDKIFNYIGKLLGVPNVLLHGVVDMYAANRSYLAEASVPVERYIVDGKHFKVKAPKTTLGLLVKGEPLEPAVFLANELVVTLIWGGQTTNLVFTGGIKVEAESITGSYTMQAKNDEGYSSLSGNIVAAGEWKNPFGIPGISIRELAVQIGGTYQEPWIDNIGIHGNLKIGDWDGSISVLVDINDPDEFVFVGATDHITLLQLMSAITVETFVAYNALPGQLKDQLDKFVNLSLEDVKISIVPVATAIGQIKFIEEGLRFNAKLNAWGWRAKAYIYVNPAMGVEVAAAMDNINLLNVFKITGAQNDPNPMLHVKFVKLAPPDLVVSSYVYLLGLSQEMQIKASPAGFTFYLERAFESICTAKLTCTYSDFNLVAKGSIYFKLNVSITTMFGNIKLADVGLDANTSLKIGVSYGFQATMSGSFQFYGQSITLPTLNVNVTPRDFRDLFDAVVQQITTNALALFKNVFKTLTEWANAVKNGVVQYAGEIATVAKNVYNAAERDVIAAYQTLGKTADDIARGFRSVYGYTATQAAAALKGANYAIDVVGNAVKGAYNQTADGVMAALKGAGYAMDQVSSFATNTLHLTTDAAKSALKAVGYAADQVESFFKDPFGIGNDIKDFFNTVFKDRENWTQELRDKVFNAANARNDGHHYNVVVCKKEWADASGLRGIVYNGDANFYAPGKIEFKIYAFTDGIFRNTGDGGFINWAFKGWYDRNENTVTFK